MPQVGAGWLRTTTLVPVFLVLTIIIAILISMNENLASVSPSPTSAMPPNHDSEPEAGTTGPVHFRYSTIPGYFAQDDSSTDAATFDPLAGNFGLKDREYDSDSTLDRRDEHTGWQRFANHVLTLNKQASAGTSYRVLYLGRHGQGYHNMALSYYGEDAWDCHYAALDGDPVPSDPDNAIVWADAHLSLIGIHQAHTIHDFWKTQLSSQHQPAPESFYLSPLDRACHTAQITFSNQSIPFKPMIKEFLREGMGIHTCDRRSTRTSISSRFPSFDIEPSFTESDELYLTDLRESDSAHTARSLALLDDILSSDASTYISMTSHGGTTAAILRAVGHRRFNVQVGGAIPVLVKVEEIRGSRPETKVDPWQPAPTCKHDWREGGAEGYQNLEDYVYTIEKGFRETGEITGRRGALG